MKRTGRKREWSITFFCLGLILLFPPLLTIFNNPGFIFGIPATYFLLFCLWGGMILVIALGAKRQRNSPTDFKPPKDIL
ncbi:MAG: hypothetical protein OQJ97_15170 [Rhodospirillales bacterium]|nr:hypothetical protein [Rhodospirillales bacterium]